MLTSSMSMALGKAELRPRFHENMPERGEQQTEHPLVGSEGDSNPMVSRDPPKVDASPTSTAGEAKETATPHASIHIGETEVVDLHDDEDLREATSSTSWDIEEDENVNQLDKQSNTRRIAKSTKSSTKDQGGSVASKGDSEPPVPEANLHEDNESPHGDDDQRKGGSIPALPIMGSVLGVAFIATIGAIVIVRRQRSAKRAPKYGVTNEWQNFDPVIPITPSYSPQPNQAHFS